MFELLSFALGDPVLESCLHEIELVRAPVVYVPLEQGLSMLLERTVLNPFLQSSFSLYIVKTSESI